MVSAVSIGTIVAVGAVAAVGAAATVYASNKSANATTNASNNAIAAQKSALTSQQQLNAPYSAIGTGSQNPDGTTSGGAIQQYQNLLGIGQAGQAGVQSTLSQTPGYQFAKQQGLDATKNAASASGMALSGNTLESLDKFSTGLADSTYQSAVGNAENAVTIGQNAAAGTGAATQNAGNNISSTLIGQGNTIAGIDANTAAGVTKALSGGVNNYTTANTLAGLNNPGSFSPSFDASLGSAIGVGNTPIDTSMVTP